RALRFDFPRRRLQKAVRFTGRIPALAKSYKFLRRRGSRYIMGLHRAVISCVDRRTWPFTPPRSGWEAGRRGTDARMRLSDERFRAAARGGNSATAALCARPDPGCVARRRSRPELPDPGGCQAASMAARD